MATVRINTSDTEWIKWYASEEDAIPYGTDVKGVMYFQAEVDVWRVDHVRFAGADMIRFEFADDAPADHSKSALYPRHYLVAE